MINMVITTAGRQAIVNAQKTGTNAVTIEKIAVGTGKYTPAASQTGLQVEVNRLLISEGGSAGDNAIHVAYRDESSNAYTVYEFGLFLTDGTMFAVYSSSTAILQKTTNSVAFLSVDVTFEDIDVESITFGDVTFSNAAATTTNAGVIAIATDDEVIEGAATQKAITPNNLKALTSTSSRAGLIAIASEAESTAGANDTKAITPLKLKGAIDARLATNAEAQTGTDATKAVTPAALASRTATESRTGLVELATTAEAITGTDTARAVTPAGVTAAITDKVKNASASVAGIVELATNTEAIAGTDTTRAVTPAGVWAAINNKVKTATDSVVGIVELATNTEAAGGTDTARAVTPRGVKEALDTRLRTIDTEDGSRLINSLKNGNASFYPSGQNVQYQARAGANQLALARFSDNGDGNSLVMFKSRGSAIHTSKRVTADDKIGQITFLADTGSLDYAGSTIGARAAYIEGGVYETPSNSANIGVRGYLRLYSCSDGASLDGKGVEILDNTLRPTDHDTHNLGTDARRFKNLYLTGTVSESSDERIKQDIAPLNDVEINLAVEVAKLIRSYKLKNDEEARTNYGVIAQEVKAKFTEANVDASSVVEEGEELSVHYRELFALIVGGLSAKIEQLENRIKELEEVNNG